MYVVPFVFFSLLPREKKDILELLELKDLLGPRSACSADDVSNKCCYFSYNTISRLISVQYLKATPYFTLLYIGISWAPWNPWTPWNRWKAGKFCAASLVSTCA